MYDVKVVSFTEQFLNTDNDLIRNILVDVLAWVAKKEAEQLSKRTIAGLERVVKLGSKTGRPIGAPRVVNDQAYSKILELNKLGRSKNSIAKELGINVGSVSDALKKGYKTDREKGGLKSQL